MIRVAWAGMVCFSSVLIVMGLGLHFCLSSFRARVICILGKSMSLVQYLGLRNASGEMPGR